MRQATETILAVLSLVIAFVVFAEIFWTVDELTMQEGQSAIHQNIQD